MEEIKYRVRNNNRFAYFSFDQLRRHDETVPSWVYEVSDDSLRKDVFTGFKDRNDIEIYTRDIVKVLYTDWPTQTDFSKSFEEHINTISKRGIIVYNSPTFEIDFGLSEKYGEHYYGSFNVGAHGRLEVIGNIHENPNLLKQ